jgi:RNA polymerase-binding transcription factor DksA
MADLEKTRVALQRKLAVLSARVEKIEAHLRDPGSKDWQERAAEIENDDVLERLDEAELREIEDIRRALARLDDGSYGSCARCGGSIARGRLEALPYTSVCIACAE